VDFLLAKDIHLKIKKILKKAGLPHVKPQQIVCFRSHGSKSRAIARIWSLPTIWQKALRVKPHYCIEVLSEKFDKLKENQKTKVLIHELLHIPKTFSGAILPHKGRGRVRVDARTVNKVYQKIKK
jgi:predicted metallopeptidase